MHTTGQQQCDYLTCIDKNFFDYKQITGCLYINSFHLFRFFFTFCFTICVFVDILQSAVKTIITVIVQLTWPAGVYVYTKVEEGGVRCAFNSF